MTPITLIFNQFGVSYSLQGRKWKLLKTPRHSEIQNNEVCFIKIGGGKFKVSKNCSRSVGTANARVLGFGN